MSTATESRAEKDTSRVGKIKKLLALSGSPNKEEAASALAKAMDLMAEDRLTLDDVQSAAPEYGKGFVRLEVDEGKVPPVHLKFVGGLVGKFFLCKTVLQNDPTRGRKKVVVHIIGRTHEAEIARHVYLFLRATYRRLWREWRRAENEKWQEAQETIAAIERLLDDPTVPDYRKDIARAQLEPLKAKQKVGVGDAYSQGTMANYYAGLTLGIRDRLERERMRIEAFHQQKTGQALVLVRDPAIDQLAVEIFKGPVPEAEPFKAKMGADSAMLSGYQDGFQVAINPAVKEADPAQKGMSNPGSDPGSKCPPSTGPTPGAIPETRNSSSSDMGTSHLQGLAPSNASAFPNHRDGTPLHGFMGSGGFPGRDTARGMSNRQHDLALTYPERRAIVRCMMGLAERQNLFSAAAFPDFHALDDRLRTDCEQLLTFRFNDREMAWMMTALAWEVKHGRADETTGNLVRIIAGLVGPGFDVSRYPFM